LAILVKLNKPHGNEELSPVQRVGLWIVRHGPNVLQQIHREFGEREEGHRILPANRTRPCDISRIKEPLIIPLCSSNDADNAGKNGYRNKTRKILI
jgi:hypothetical protein